MLVREVNGVRLVMALALVVWLLAACGGGAAEPMKVAPGVTTAPTSAPAGATPKPSGGYDYGY